MATINIYDLESKKTAEMELNDNIFGVPINKDVLHQVIVGQLLNKRSGNASTKGRSEVKRSKTKLWRQKGTGRARVGMASSPTRIGGGVAFGPIPRSYTRKVPKRVRKAALCMALTDKFQSNKLVVLSDFNLPEIKTKKFVEVMDNFEVRRVLIVTDDKNEKLEKSSKNVPWVKVMRYEGINVYDLLKYEHLFLLQPAIARLEEALIS